MWVPIDQQMRDGTEMIKWRHLTGLPTPTLLGHLTLLWLWALDNAPDGRLPSEGFIIAAAMQWPGDADTLIHDLIASGLVWATNSEGDQYEIASFAERMASYSEKVADTKAKTRERVQRYRDRIRATGESLSDYTKYREEVYARDDHRCVYCGKGGPLCLDHLIPVIRGGSGTPENLVAACKRCNSGKAGRLPHEWGYTFAQPHAEILYREGLSRLPVTPVTVTGVTGVRPVTVHNTIDQSTQDHSTAHDTDRARLDLDAGQGARAIDVDGRSPARFISDEAKLRAFAEYRPTDDDRKWAAKNAPTIALDAELENLGEWCRLNRTKIISDYNSPKDFWRRWMRRAVEKQQGGNNGRSTYADQRLSLGEVPAPGEPEDSRDRLRARRVAN